MLFRVENNSINAKNAANIWLEHLHLSAEDLVYKAEKNNIYFGTSTESKERNGVCVHLYLYKLNKSETETPRG